MPKITMSGSTLTSRLSCIRLKSSSTRRTAILARQNTTLSITFHQPMRAIEQADPMLCDLLRKELRRQKRYVNLIASENFMSQAVLEALGSAVQNKSSEGYPGARYHSCCENIDEIERLCQHRALSLFDLDPEHWGVNVQPNSGSNANLYVYTALLESHDRIMGLELTHGGHISHGYQRGRAKLSAASKMFESIPYEVNPDTGTIDYDGLERLAITHRPRIIIAGTSAYPRLIDYARVRQIADKIEAYVLTDMSHISGLVAGQAIPPPFSFSDVVTTSTSKTLRGPRGGMIFFRHRRLQRPDPESEAHGTSDGLGKLINASVFPGHQSSPHNNTTAALAVALRQAATPDFKIYQQSVLRNARCLADGLVTLGYALFAGGTDTHLALIDLKPHGIDGARVEHVLERVGIASNRNMLPGDGSAREPSGLRLGSPAMTSFGFNTTHFVRVAKFVDDAVRIAKTASLGATKYAQGQGNLDPNGFKCFVGSLQTGSTKAAIEELEREVQACMNL